MTSRANNTSMKSVSLIETQALTVREIESGSTLNVP